MRVTTATTSSARSSIAGIALAGLSALAIACVGSNAAVPDAGGTGGSTPAGAGGAPVTGAGGAGGGGGANAGSGGALGSGGAGVSTGGAPGAGGAVGSGGRGGSVTTGSGGTATSAGLPYSENFEDGVANGFVSGIDEEQAPLGTWAVVMDGATRVYREQVTTDDPSWAVGGSYQWTDQHLETRLKIVSGADEVLIAIAVRFSGFMSYYFLEIRNDAVKIRIRTPSTTSDLVSYSFPMGDLVDGTWYKFGLGARGPTLTAYFNDAPVATVTDATLTAGGIAFGVRDAVVDFDDVTVTPM